VETLDDRAAGGAPCTPTNRAVGSGAHPHRSLTTVQGMIKTDMLAASMLSLRAAGYVPQEGGGASQNGVTSTHRRP